VLTAHFKPALVNKNEIGFKRILESVEVSNENEEISISRHKHSQSNLTSAIMERMEKLEDQNRFENEDTRISNKSNLNMKKITSTPCSIGGRNRDLDPPNISPLPISDFDNQGSIQKAVQNPTHGSGP
jgi:ABC-type oligopeptide transport system ATPase subunit|tara:strand:+ start:376 stop:759 length:384 start_codon:yes stop_codon:yes gene_type:complete